jgi:hypothetical protein
MVSSPFESERVRRNTAPAINEKIDEIVRECVRRYALAPKDVLSRRIDELDREFDIERTLQANASLAALTGILLGVTVNRRWLAFSTGVLGFLLLHSTQGWCPPLPVLRRLGVRTRSEIERERFVLKFLRGDFDGIDWSTPGDATDALLSAAEK